MEPVQQPIFQNSKTRGNKKVTKDRRWYKVCIGMLVYSKGSLVVSGRRFRLQDSSRCHHRYLHRQEVPMDR